MKDPVCGMTVDPTKTAHHAEHRGEAYHFCSAGCRTKFIADPEKYLGVKTPTEEHTPAGTIYTCPMHPEIRQVTRRFWIGLILTLPVVVLEMGGHLFELHWLVAPGVSVWVQFAFATPVVLWAGWPFFMRGWQSLVTHNLNMFTLIALGTGVAWFYSVVATVLPNLFPPAFRAMDGAVAVYYEAAAVITV
ncbi:MAG: YHS domain-containing protein, partial [Alphaproteobacteria bacterium]|nr:YHS domain-containing protein [Alphaproteobacteria bacterium]